ncbi:hypothetical protein [Shigella phage Z31]|uniref:Uncharacterized protein n=1 Tax=Shigella phage Z31 TaxID=2675202 RepID=A0A6B9M318_9CAUD|nr:hypothetical protein [Shigella phage Z31]
MAIINGLNIETTHIKDIKVGDIVLFHGVEKTVTEKDIKEDSFMGRSLFGDSYCLGYRAVLKVIKNNR